MEVPTKFKIFHPFVHHWMKKNNLRLDNTHTEYGLFATTQLSDLNNSRYLFTDETKETELQRLNKVFGTNFGEELLESRGLCHKLNLLEISEKVLKAYEQKENYFGMKEPPHIYIGGITLPNRDYLYIEFDAMFYEAQGYDGISHGWDGIPINFK